MTDFVENSIEKLNDVFNQFFVELGYPEIECFFSDEFAYYHTTEEISYTLLEMPLLDIGFKQYLKKTYPNLPECSMMVFSLLHELGHHLTMDSISRKKMLKCKKDKKRLEKEKVNTPNEIINQQMRYCALYDEMIATRKATEILIENYAYILEFENVWYNAVMEFYTENNVDLS